MFSLLVALTMYVALAPVRPAASVIEYRPPAVRRQSLPLAAAVPKPAPQGPSKKDENRIGVETTARAAVIVDWATGGTLFEKDADTPMPIASVTKLMTALVVLSMKPDWQEEIEVLAGDERPGGIPYLIPGEVVTVENLFNLSLVASANGATVALARSTGLSEQEFAAKMNDMAAKIGMTHSTFTDPTGLDAENAASARDVAVLIRTAFASPEIQAAAVKKSYSFKAKTGLNHAVKSTDELLGSFLDSAPYRFMGGKTGYLEEAGYCFGATAENGDGNRVIAVVLGAPTKEARFKEVKTLIYWAFDAYSWPPSRLTRRN
jgi:D-alanyl-D-alanine carboxypeptidase